MDMAKRQLEQRTTERKALHLCPRDDATLRAPYRDQSSDSIAAPGGDYRCNFRAACPKFGFLLRLSQAWCGDRPQCGISARK